MLQRTTQINIKALHLKHSLCYILSLCCSLSPSPNFLHTTAVLTNCDVTGVADWFGRDAAGLWCYIRVAILWRDNVRERLCDADSEVVDRPRKPRHPEYPHQQKCRPKRLQIQLQ